MPLLVICKIAVDALTRNATRTALTMLGIVIGVAAVIALVALGKGAQAAIDAQIRSTGANAVIVQGGNFAQGGVRLAQGTASTMTPDDVREIAQVPGVRYAVAVISTRGQVIAGNQNWNTVVQGVDVELPLVREWPLLHGRFLEPIEIATAAKVVVLGAIVSAQLFGPGENPVGQTLRIQNQPFTVVGVLTRKGQTGTGQDQDDVVFAPYTTMMRKVLGVTTLQQAQLTVVSADQVPAVIERIETLLRARHRIPPGEPNDFLIRTMEELASVRRETTQTMTTLLACIAGVSLLVGGIGIMNIMLVSVMERTREIGLRMAIGARGRDVRLQFLVEAMALSLSGATIGVGLGASLAHALSTLQGWPIVISTDAVAMAFLFAVMIGIFFGSYPAGRAASLDPIEALRFE